MLCVRNNGIMCMAEEWSLLVFLVPSNLPGDAAVTEDNVRLVGI